MRELPQTFLAWPPSFRPEPAAHRWQLLRQGQQPEVSPILADTAQLSLEQLATLLAVDQWERWRRGERVPAEAYLQQYPALQTDLERALELVYGEFLLREECGEAPALEEYLQRFPQY